MRILKIEPTEWLYLKGDQSMFIKREYPFWDKFINANKDGIGLLAKGDLELKELIVRAFDYARTLNCTIDEVVLVTSMLMVAETFYSWLSRGCANRLEATIREQHDPELRFQIGNYNNGVVIRFNSAMLPDMGTGCTFLDSHDCELLPALVR